MDPEDQVVLEDLEAQAVQAAPADQVILVNLMNIKLNNNSTYRCSWLRECTD